MKLTLDLDAGRGFSLSSGTAACQDKRGNRLLLNNKTPMRYLIAILLPPLAVLLCGKPVQFVINILLTLAFWIPGMIHALLVVHNHLEEKRTDRIVKAIKSSR